MNDQENIKRGSHSEGLFLLYQLLCYLIGPNFACTA